MRRKNNNDLLVSIITPSFNQANFIGRTIDSVLGQTYKNIEYIVADGGSTDGTVEILKSYGENIRWFSKKDKGQMDALNKTMKLIKGDIICFINSDDYYDKRAIEIVVNYFKSKHEAMVVSGDYYIVDSDEKEATSFVRWYKNLWRKFHSFNALCMANYINQPSTFWRRSVYEKLGGYDEKWNTTFDYEYWLRILNSGIKIDLINDRLSYYRLHKNSKGVSMYEKRAHEEVEVQKNYNQNVVVTTVHKILNCLSVIYFRSAL